MAFFVILLFICLIYYRQSIFSYFSPVQQRVSNKNFVPISHFKGDLFETFVLDVLYPQSSFDLIYRTSDYRQNSHRFAESSLLPDFKFRDILSGREFWIEAKYRSDFDHNGNLYICRPDQLHRYRTLTDGLPVFIVVGFSGTPSNPDYVFQFPLDNFNYSVVFQSILPRYEVYSKK